MTLKVFLNVFFVWALTSCSINAGRPNNSPQITMPTALIAIPTPHITTPTATQITIPAACLQNKDASDWSAKVAGSCITSQSRKAIIEILVTVWLNHFVSTNVPEEIRLEKFTIDSIDIEDSPNLPVSYKPDFTAVVTYSVKPTVSLSSNPTSWWVAGDGRSGDDGWVRYKRDYVGIIKTGDFYEIRIWGYNQA
jgi:hypothetical protein